MKFEKDRAAYDQYGMSIDRCDAIIRKAEKLADGPMMDVIAELEACRLVLKSKGLCDEMVCLCSVIYRVCQYPEERGE